MMHIEAFLSDQKKEIRASFLQKMSSRGPGPRLRQKVIYLRLTS